MRRPNETLTVVDDSTRVSGQLAAFNTLLCASDAVYGTEYLLDLGWEFECRKLDAMASGYGCDGPMSLEIANAARSDGAVPGFIEQSVLNVRGKSASEEGAARGLIMTSGAWITQPGRLIMGGRRVAHTPGWTPIITSTSTWFGAIRHISRSSTAGSPTAAFLQRAC